MKVVIPAKPHPYMSPQPVCSVCGRDDEPVVETWVHKTTAYLCRPCTKEILDTFLQDGTPRCSYCGRVKPQQELRPANDPWDKSKQQMCGECFRIGLDALKKTADRL